jgi:hypothetical protein
VFQAVTPAAIQDRYFCPAIPPMLYLAAGTVHRLTVGWSARRAVLAESTVLAVAIALILPTALALPAKQQVDAVEAAKLVWSERLPRNPSVLVVADEVPEGAVVAELSMQDPERPSLFAVRGSRLLGGGGYNNEDYLPRFSSAKEVGAAVDAYAIPLVLIHSTPGHDRWAHIGQTEQARALQPERWDLVRSIGPANDQWRLFRIRGNVDATADVAKLEQLSAPHALGGG